MLDVVVGNDEEPRVHEIAQRHRPCDEHANAVVSGTLLGLVAGFPEAFDRGGQRRFAKPRVVRSSETASRELTSIGTARRLKRGKIRRAR
ncbi:MAG: hypothetical protein NVSMB19_18280 [Vulcanimicrobiaceae bacterium]